MYRARFVTGFALLVLVSLLGLRVYGDDNDNQKNAANVNANQLVDQGRQIFRFDTFGDQAFWGDMLKLHMAVEGAPFGGVGPGLSPRAALGAGLKIDVDAVPKDTAEQLKNARVNLDDPAVTLALLKANAVVGLTGFFNSGGSLDSIGIQCALCHSTVDNSALRRNLWRPSF